MYPGVLGRGEDLQTGSRAPCKIGGQDRSDTSTSQRTLKTANSHQQIGERPGTDSPAELVPVEGTNLADVLIQNWERRDFCCFKSPSMWRFVKIARKLIRLLNQNPYFHESPGDSYAHQRWSSLLQHFQSTSTYYHGCSICSKKQDHSIRWRLKLNRWKQFFSARRCGGRESLRTPHFAPPCWLHPWHVCLLLQTTCVDYHLAHEILLWGK